MRIFDELVFGIMLDQEALPAAIGGRNSKHLGFDDFSSFMNGSLHGFHEEPGTPFLAQNLPREEQMEAALT